MNSRSGHPFAAIGICLALLAPAQALAVEPDEMLADPALEARAEALSKELRCVVCQNQTIDGSAAPLARDMRLLVRERLAAGDTDAQAKAYLVDLVVAHLAALAVCAQDPDAAVRRDIADVLGLAHDPAALPLAESLLADRDRPVAKAAERAVARLRATTR